MTDIREFPATEPRVETGPIRFGTDWPGTFIRGDNSFAAAMALEVALAALESGPDRATLAITIVQLRGFQRLLQESNLATRAAPPQGEKHADR